MFIAFLLSNTATAGGYFLTDVGSKGAGRAGAFVAGANDISAIWYNPAALIRSKNGHFGLHMAGVKQFISFDRTEKTAWAQAMQRTTRRRRDSECA